MAKTLLLRGGEVLDGTGSPSRRADVLISGDTILRIGNGLGNADTVLDVGGKMVAPGFIDTHSHADGGITDDPDAETQIRQGITTSVVGQDGGHNYPLADWFAKMTQKPAAINYASFVGHGTARNQILGKEFQRAATADEIRQMRALVAREMKAGGLGLSSGLEYDPGHYSTTEELIALAQVAGTYGGLYISHVRDEQDGALTSFRELIRIAREGHLPAQISHIKLGSAPVWGKTREVFGLMDDARREGLDITADVYPYTYWQSTITALVATRDWENRSIWDAGLAGIGGPGNILLTNFTPDPSWQGKTLAAISAQTGKDAVSVIQDIVRRTHGKPGERLGSESVVVTAMQEKDLRAFIAHPRIMFCTDGGLHGSHPRGAGSFPRLLGYYVREQHVLPLPEMVRKATSLPATRMDFADRGMLAPGKKADVVIFDPRTVRDTATTKDPRAEPIGLTDVFVNGVQVLKAGQPTGAHPGVILRRTTR